MWIINENQTVAMSCLRKCGSTSIINCLSVKGESTNEEVINIPTRVFWIRDPISRLQSCYSFFYYLNEKDQNGTHQVTKEVTASWESFVDYILANDDPHWKPQAEQLKIEGVPVWTNIHRFEDIVSIWGGYIEGFLPWYNACTQLTINDYRKDEIEIKYKEDIDLCLSL
jgi:hypothetical protein